MNSFSRDNFLRFAKSYQGATVTDREKGVKSGLDNLLQMVSMAQRFVLARKNLDSYQRKNGFASNIYKLLSEGESQLQQEADKCAIRLVSKTMFLNSWANDHGCKFIMRKIDLNNESPVELAMEIVDTLLTGIV